MIKISIGIPKFDEALARTNKRWTAVKKRVQSEVPNYLYSVQQTAQTIIRNEAYETGRLHNSIRVKVDRDKMSGHVIADQRVAFYAEWVEFGHFAWGKHWIPGVYYMTRAKAYNRPKIKEATAGFIEAVRYYDEGGVHRTEEGREMQWASLRSSGQPSVKKILSARKRRRAAISKTYKRARNKIRRSGQRRLKYNISRRK